MTGKIVTNSYEEASEHLLNKAKKALHNLGCYEIKLGVDLPDNIRDPLVDLRNAVWELEAWMGYTEE